MELARNAYGAKAATFRPYSLRNSSLLTNIDWSQAFVLARHRGFGIPKLVYPIPIYNPLELRILAAPVKSLLSWAIDQRFVPWAEQWLKSFAYHPIVLVVCNLLAGCS